MIADDIGPAQAFSTPFPYLFYAVMWVLVIPIYLGAHSWFGVSLPRLAVGGLLLAPLPILIAWSTFLPNRAIFATAMFVGAALVGAFGFWVCLRLSTP